MTHWFLFGVGVIILIVLVIVVPTTDSTTSVSNQPMPQKEHKEWKHTRSTDEQTKQPIVEQNQEPDIDIYEDNPEGLYDIVIPFHPKDTDMVKRCVSSIATHVPQFGRIFLLTPNPNTIHRKHMFGDVAPRVVVIDEQSVLDFSHSDVKDHLSQDPSYQTGWYFQQFLKLYAHRIPTIRQHYVCVDADVMFLNDVEFLDASTQEMLITLRNRPISDQYVNSGSYLLPELKFGSQSAIVDHMIFDGIIVQQLIRDVENQRPEHPFWKSVCSAALQSGSWCGFSEYETVYAYTNQYFPHRIRYRPLRYMATGDHTLDVSTFDLVVYHSWMGKDYTVFT